MTGSSEDNHSEIKSQNSHRSEEIKQKRAIYNKDYKTKNKEAISLQRKEYRNNNKEKIIDTINKWRQKNQDNVASWGHKRRAAKKGSGGWFTPDEIQTVLIKQDGRCVYCKSKLVLTGKGIFHKDHILPIKLGGSSFIDNIQLLCPRCNLSKGAKHPDDYEQSIGHVS